MEDTNKDNVKDVEALQTDKVSMQPASTAAGRYGNRILKLMLLPVVVLWWTAAFLLAWLLSFTIIPAHVLARRLYWAVPIVPHVFKQFGWLQWPVRLGFEGSYCINVLTRFFTLPLRRSLPSFYIVGFPKCGTTSLAEHLKRHPGISGPAGLPYHEALCKETHFFEGVLGRACAYQTRLYRSFFPTILHKWWADIKGIPNWMTFDACPVHACLPYVASRIAAVTPNAKIIIMLRDPVAGVFSAEVMLSDMGVPLQWASLSQPVTTPSDPRFEAPSKDENALWDTIADLGVQDELPAAMPEALYMTLGGVLRCGQYPDLIKPYLEHFPHDNVMIVNFNDFRSHTEEVVRDVIQFIGASQHHFKYQPLPPAMQNNYQGRKIHPSVAHKLRLMFSPSIRQLQDMLGRDMGWGVVEEDPHAV